MHQSPAGVSQMTLNSDELLPPPPTTALFLCPPFPWRPLGKTPWSPRLPVGGLMGLETCFHPPYGF